MNIPAELRNAVAQGLPVELTDGEQRYFLISAEVYDRFIASLDLAPPTAADRRAQLQSMGRAAGWERPDAAIFDDLEPQ